MTNEIAQLSPEIVEMLSQYLKLGAAGLAASAGPAAVEVANKVKDHLVPKITDRVWDRFTKDPERKEAMEDEVHDVLAADAQLAEELGTLVEPHRSVIVAWLSADNSHNVQQVVGDHNVQRMDVRRRPDEDDEVDG